MKTTLFLAMSLVLASFSPSTAHAQDKATVTAFETAIGATSAQGVLVSYFGVKSLGQGVAAEAFDSKDAMKMAAVYQSTSSSASEGLTKLMGEVEFTPADTAYFKDVIKYYDTIGAQAKALMQVIEGDEDAGEVYEEKGEAAKQLIIKIFGDSGVSLTEE